MCIRDSFGSDEDSLARAAEFIQENTKTDIVDINMGCPVNKIVKNESGAMWLKDPEKIYKIINKVQSVLDIPLTVKMRTGWSDSSLAVENALAAEAAGVSALAMHGRTREQMYTCLLYTSFLLLLPSIVAPATKSK